MGFDADSIAEWKNAESDASLKADPDASFEGRALLSMETQPDAPLCLDWLVADDLGAFLRLIKPLSAREKDVMLSYYVLGCSQRQIAHVLGLVQQSSISAVVVEAKGRLQGRVTVKVHKAKHEVITRTDPEYFGNFRVKVEQSATMLSDRSGVRMGDSIDYGAEHS